MPQQTNISSSLFQDLLNACGCEQHLLGHSFLGSLSSHTMHVYSSTYCYSLHGFHPSCGLGRGVQLGVMFAQVLGDQRLQGFLGHTCWVELPGHSVQQVYRTPREAVSLPALILVGGDTEARRDG